MQTTENPLTLIARSSNIGLWDWNLRTNKVYFSPEWKKHIGYEEHEISDEYSEWESRLHPEDLERVKAQTLAFIKKPWSEYFVEFRFRHKDGSYRWILAKATLEYGKDGKPERMLGAHIDITERQQNEQALRRSQDLLHKAQRVAKLGGWWYDPKVQIPEWTDEIFHIFGMEPSSQVPSYRDHSEFIHPEDWQRFDQTFSKAVREGVGYDIEFRIVRKDGEIRHVHSICAPVVDEQGRVIELNGTLQDITERKAAEEAVLASQEQYRHLFESIRDAILVADTNRIIVDCNQALIDTFGYEKSELLGKQTMHLYADEEQFKEMGAAIQKHHGETSFSHAIDYRKKSGEIFRGETSVFYLRDSAGQLYGVIGLIRDISSKLESERRLRQSETRLRLMVENLFDAVLAIDAQGVIRFANRAACKLFDRRLNELVGSIFGFPVSLDTVQNIDIIQKNQSIRYAEIRMSAMDWHDETVYLASIRDVTERVLVRLEREKHQENLLQLQRLEAIGTLAGGIAHDFNNILTPILGFTELARDVVEDNEVAMDCLSEVYQSATRAKDLVAQILAFSRQGEKTYRPILVEPIIKEVLKLLRSTIPTSIDIQHNIQSRGMIIGDETEVHQILMNLCTNACHAMEGLQGEMRVSLHDLKIRESDKTIHPDLAPGHYIHLSVRDNGCGMERSVMEKIFDPYFSTKDKDKGTGLGLSVVHGIVQNHGGIISVDSNINQGTTFDVYLPRTTVKQEHRLEVDTDLEMGSGRVLLVDDDPQVLKLNGRILKSLGYSVTARVSSLEALQLFEAKPHEFDLLFTDMTMPGLTGEILAKKCLAINPDLPVVMATGFSEQMSEERAKELGIAGFLFKPVTKVQMARVLKATMRSDSDAIKENSDVS